MFGESMVILLSVGLLTAVIFYLHHLQSKALITHVEMLKADLPTSDYDLTELREDVLDVVHDTIRNLQPPNAFDHLIGALAQPLQAWAMRKAGINPATGQPLNELLEEKIDEIIQ